MSDAHDVRQMSSLKDLRATLTITSVMVAGTNGACKTEGIQL